MEKIYWLLVVSLAVFAGYFISTYSPEDTLMLSINRDPTYNVSIPEGQFWYAELESRQYNIELESNEEVDVYIFTSWDDMDKWITGEEYGHYYDCYAAEVKEYEASCVVNTGSVLVIINPTILGFGEDADVDVFFS